MYFPLMHTPHVQKDFAPREWMASKVPDNITATILHHTRVLLVCSKGSTV